MNVFDLVAWNLCRRDARWNQNGFTIEHKGTRLHAADLDHLQRLLARRLREDASRQNV